MDFISIARFIKPIMKRKSFLYKGEIMKTPLLFFLVIVLSPSINAINPPKGLKWYINYHEINKIFGSDSNDGFLSNKLKKETIFFDRCPYEWSDKLSVDFDGENRNLEFYFWKDSLYQVKVNRWSSYEHGMTFAEVDSLINAIGDAILNKYGYGNGIVEIKTDTTWEGNWVSEYITLYGNDNSIFIVEFSYEKYGGSDGTSAWIEIYYRAPEFNRIRKDIKNWYEEKRAKKREVHDSDY
jgi:hypothetical protein